MTTELKDDPIAKQVDRLLLEIHWKRLHEALPKDTWLAFHPVTAREIGNFCSRMAFRSRAPLANFNKGEFYGLKFKTDYTVPIGRVRVLFGNEPAVEWIL